MNLFEVLCTGTDRPPPAWPLILFSRSLWGVHKLSSLLNTSLAWPHLLRAGKTSVPRACWSCTVPSTRQVLESICWILWREKPCLISDAWHSWVTEDTFYLRRLDCIRASHELHGRLGWQFLFESNLLGIFLTSSHVIKPWPGVEYHQKERTG